MGRDNLYFYTGVGTAYELISCGRQNGFILPSGDMFVLGDSNADGVLDIADGVTVLTYLFGGVSVNCLDAADPNDSGEVDIADGIYILSYLFANGPDPVAPFGACGPDDTEDALTCFSYGPCE